MFDLLIRNGRVIDGAGNPWYRADVGIVGDRIAAVGPLGNARAARTIDAEGLFVCPGFVDMHTHSDIQLLANPRHEAKVMQGVTLDVIGQDGLSFAPVNDEVMGLMRRQLAGWNGDPPNVDFAWRSVSEYLDRFDGKVAINVAYLLPHGTIRVMAMGMANRPPSGAELAEMKRLVREGMEQGAVGLSTGLTYTPGAYASDDEIVELCRELRPFGGFYCPHHRNYGRYALQGYADSIAIARRAGVPLHLAHAHLGFAVNRGKAPELLRMIDEARAEGVEVTMDTYPYLAGSTYLQAILPLWVHDGGPAATLARLRDPEARARMREAVEVTGSDGYHDVVIEWDTIQIAGVASERNAWAVGLRLDEAARRAGESPWDFCCRLLLEEELGVSIIHHIGNEENVRAIMQHPAHTAGSDGILVGAQPHPRAWGTFARYLAVYVRELGLLSWEAMVRKLTSLPCQRLGFLDRGLLRPGMMADVVCFDPLRVRDTATYEQPRRTAEGFPYVVVNGTLVVDGGRHTGATPGRALWRRAPAA